MTKLDVSGLDDALARLVGHHSRFWKAAGNIETLVLADSIESVEIRAPIFVCGLARSGSTVLLEMLAERPGAVSHRYSDFPFTFTPYWWSRALTGNPLSNKAKHDRAHGDGVLVNAESPEAMDEMIWMAFFEFCHAAGKSDLFDASASNPPFERFYANHIKKMLLTRGGTRYLCKGNYHVSRMAYLQRMFPDARFILPVREPAGHIGSLMRQHQRFCEAGLRNPRIVRQMNIAGHFEFGLNRRPIHVGNAARIDEIQTAWRNGEEALGWALYWDMLYSFLHRQLAADAALSRATLVVRFEDLCTSPAETIRAVFENAMLPYDESAVESWAATIRRPDYYESPLSTDEKRIVGAVTRESASLFGYS